MTLSRICLEGEILSFQCEGDRLLVLRNQLPLWKRGDCRICLENNFWGSRNVVTFRMNRLTLILKCSGDARYNEYLC